MGKKPIELRMCGMFNIIFGLMFLVIYLFPFVLGVILGGTTDRELLGVLDWFMLMIVNRIIFAVTFVFSGLLLLSGYYIFKIDSRGRRLALIASLVLCISTFLLFVTAIVRENVYQYTEVYYLSPVAIIQYVFYAYVCLMAFYLSEQSTKKIFNDDYIEISFKKPIIVIVFSFFTPSILWLLTRLFYIGSIIK